MRDQDYQQLEATVATLAGALGHPNTVEHTITRAIVAIAGLTPVVALARWTGEQPVDPAMAEWLTPAVIDAIERAGTALDELYNELETAADEVTILEPGSLGSQSLVDMPTRQGRPAADGRPVGARGDLIR